MAGSAQVLVVEDVREVRAMLVATLEAGGYQALGVGDAGSMRAILETQNFEVILLDLRLPDADGLELVQALRERRGSGVIIVSSRGAPHERARGLEAGADDYIAKPVYPRELLARVHNVFERVSGRRDTPREQTGRQLGGWLLDRDNRCLTRLEGGEPPALTRAEFDLLCVLADRPGRILTRAMLAELLGTGSSVDRPRKIDVLVSRLRKKLAAGGGQSLRIETCRGYGYRLMVRPHG